MPPGVVVETRQEMAEINRRGPDLIPDPEWRGTCGCGRVHTHKGLKRSCHERRYTHRCEDCLDEHEEVELVCLRCGDVVEPRYVPDPGWIPYPHYVQGRRSLTVSAPPALLLYSIPVGAEVLLEDVGLAPLKGRALYTGIWDGKARFLYSGAIEVDCPVGGSR